MKSAVARLLSVSRDCIFLLQSWRQRRAVQPLVNTQLALNEWWQKPQARELLADESNAVNRELTEVHGNHLMHLGVAGHECTFNRCRLGHCFSLSPQAAKGVDAQALFEQLPLTESIVDTAVLQHVLDYSVNPHYTLREIDRVLTAHGRVVIVGFDPYNVHSWRNLVMRAANPLAHRCRHDLSARRVQDWLTLLGFDVQIVRREMVVEGKNTGKIRQYLKQLCLILLRLGLPLGKYYVIVAQKRVSPLTPSAPSWFYLSSKSQFSSAAAEQRSK